MVFQQQDDTAYKLKLTTKKLKSGNFQVKFQVFSATPKRFYGYMLASPGTTLKQVVLKINEKFNQVENKDYHYHSSLYSLKSTSTEKESILVFNN